MRNRKFSPMLAAEYDDLYAHIVENEPHRFVMQPKLDGARGVMDHSGFKTRSGNKIRSYDKFWRSWVESCQTLGELDWLNDMTLDGELYRHGLSFDEVGADIRRKSEPVSDLKFHLFDCYSKSNPSSPFSARYRLLEKIFKKIKDISSFGQCIELVPNMNVSENSYQEALKSGYEGVVYRMLKSTYEMKSRGLGMMKRKEAFDEEARVIDVVKCTKDGVEMAGVLMCVSNDGVEFKCSAGGVLDIRIDMLKNKDNYLNSSITFSFNGKTSKGHYRHARFLRMYHKS